MPPRTPKPTRNQKKTPAEKSAPRHNARGRRSAATAAEGGLSKTAKKAKEKAEERAAAREEKLEKLRREAKDVEPPTDPVDDQSVLSRTQSKTRKRPSNAAYDDRSSSKRSRADGDGANKASSGVPPQRRNQGLEQPPAPSDLSHEPENPASDPVEAMGAFSRLATEIRDKILKYLLVWPHDIRVFKGWSLVFPRGKPDLDIAVLSTCRALYQQGLRILFGENTFYYDLRDPAEYVQDTDPMLSRIFAKALVPINRFGHLIRHVKVNVPANRLQVANMDNFSKAILKFAPENGLLEPANIHTLTLKLPALTLRDLKLPGWRGNPNLVPATKFFDEATRVRQALASLDIQHVRIVATDRAGDVFEHAIDLRHHRKQRQAARDGDRSLDRDVKGVRAYVQGQVARARARVYNIPVRLWELAVLGFPGANAGGDYWRLLGKREDGGRHLEDADARSLSPDYREPSY